MSESGIHGEVGAASRDRVRPGMAALRIALIIDGLAFATSAALNFGAQIPLGMVTLSFPVRIIQAGVGEAIIGIALLGAGASLNRGLAWLAFWLSVAGTAFGMVATAVGSGPVWSVHVVFASLALVVLGLLVWTGRSDVQEHVPHAARDRQTTPPSLIGLMGLTSVTLLAASIIHFGPALPFAGFGISDQFGAAAGPEAILGILLALGAAYLASGRTGSREMALASTVFTLLLSLYGLSVTLPMALAGDVVYHVVLVVLLGTIIVGLVLPMMRSNSGRDTFTVGSR
jgi:hypothetical protein